MKRKKLKHSHQQKRISFERAIANLAATKKGKHRQHNADHTAAKVAAEDGSPRPAVHFTDVKLSTMF
jgi:hypothetical protein